MLRNVEFVLLAIAVAFVAAATAVAVVAEDEDCKSCNAISGGGEDDGEPDTDSTSELSLLSDLYGEHKEVSTCTYTRKKEKMNNSPRYRRIILIVE